ncbi:MAG: hypothetical protein IKG85_09605 [Clostridia bacterium]|nr:hypothetical protein [Clostridia bacterium]
MKSPCFNTADGEYYEYRVVGKDDTVLSPAREPDRRITIEVGREDGERRYFVYSGLFEKDALDCARLLPWECLQTAEGLGGNR